MLLEGTYCCVNPNSLWHGCITPSRMSYGFETMMSGWGVISSACAPMKHRWVMVPRRLTGKGPVFTSGLNIQAKRIEDTGQTAGCFSSVERVHMDIRTHTVKNGHTDMLQLIRYDPGRFTGRTTSETLYSTLDTALHTSTRSHVFSRGVVRSLRICCQVRSAKAWNGAFWCSHPK